MYKILAAAFLSIMLLGSVSAQIELDSQSGPPGGTATLTLDYQEANSITDLTVDILYDSNVLIPHSTSGEVDGCLANLPSSHQSGFSGCADSNPGQIRITIAEFNDVVMPTTQPLGTITFDIAAGAAIGSTSTEFAVIEVRDASGQIANNNLQTVDGAVVIGGPVLDFVPAGDGTNTVDAGEAEVGSAAPGADINVTEAGIVDVVLDSCSISGTNTGEFSFSYAGTDAPLPATFTGGSGQSGTITVDCTPGGRGERTAQLDCSVEDTGMTETQTPSWPLTCVGLAPNVTIPAGPIMFNGTVAGADPAATITVTSPDDGFTSTANMVEASAGTGDGQITVSDAGPFSIAPDGSADFEVSCDSSAEGTFTRTIDFTWENPDPAGPTSDSVDATCTVSDTDPVYESDPAPGATIALSAPSGSQSAPGGVDVRNANPNTEADDLVINSATPSDAAVFSVTVNQTMFPGGGDFVADAIEVTCTPEGVGTVNGMLTVETNDPNEPADGFTYPLECQGTGEELSTNPNNGGTLNLGTVPPGTQTPEGTISFSNNRIDGGGSIDISCDVTDTAGVFTFEPDPIDFMVSEGEEKSVGFRATPNGIASFTADVTCSSTGGTMGLEFTVTASGRLLAVPTMSRWGLIVMSLMLLLLGGFATRRMMA